MAVALGVVLWVILYPEPGYAGRGISEWVEAASKSTHYREREEALDALEKIGSKAGPSLRSMLRKRDTKTKLTMQRWATKVPFLKIRFVPACQQHQIAISVVSRTGAAEAIPELTALLNDPCAYLAAGALTRCGPRATASLIEGLTNEHATVRWTAVANLSRYPTDLVISNLVPMVRDKDTGVRFATVVSLGQVGRRYDLVIPALVLGLDDHDVTTRAWAARSLQLLGTNAAPAMERLSLMTSDESEYVRRTAMDAISAIKAKQ